MNVTQALEALKSTTPKIFVHTSSGTGYGIKRYIKNPPFGAAPFAHTDSIPVRTARALIKAGIKLHAENTWVW